MCTLRMAVAFLLLVLIVLGPAESLQQQTGWSKQVWDCNRILYHGKAGMTIKQMEAARLRCFRAIPMEGIEACDDIIANGYVGTDMSVQERKESSQECRDAITAGNKRDL